MQQVAKAVVNMILNFYVVAKNTSPIFTSIDCYWLYIGNILQQPESTKELPQQDTDALFRQLNEEQDPNFSVVYSQFKRSLYPGKWDFH